MLRVSPILLLTLLSVTHAAPQPKKDASGLRFTLEQTQDCRPLKASIEALAPLSAQAQYLKAVCLMGLLKVPAQKDLALQAFRDAARRGQHEAQFTLGVLYQRGGPSVSIKPNPRLAAEWYRRSSQGGNREALFNLAGMLMRGEGGPRDEARAIRLYQASSKKGFTAANYALGEAYRDGLGVTPDQAKAVRYYRQGAAQGDPKSMLRLSGALRDGRGTGRDAPAALSWLTRAASARNGEAEMLLAAYYASSPDPSDSARGLALLRQAAKGGSLSAALQLGEALERGAGGKVEAAGARNAYLQATLGGSAEGHYRLALLLSSTRGGPQDIPLATLHFEAALEQDHPGAAYALATLNETTLHNPALALGYYRQAATLGAPGALEAVTRLERASEGL